MQISLEEYEMQRRMTKKETEDLQEVEVAIENKVQAISIGVIGINNQKQEIEYQESKSSSSREDMGEGPPDPQI